MSSLVVHQRNKKTPQYNYKHELKSLNGINKLSKHNKGNTIKCVFIGTMICCGILSIMLWFIGTFFGILAIVFFISAGFCMFICSTLLVMAFIHIIWICLKSKKIKHKRLNKNQIKFR